MVLRSLRYSCFRRIYVAGIPIKFHPVNNVFRGACIRKIINDYIYIYAKYNFISYFTDPMARLQGRVMSSDLHR